MNFDNPEQVSCVLTKTQLKKSAYYQAHKKQYQEYAKRWWKTHPEKLRAKERRRSLRRRDKVRIYSKQYRADNLHQIRAGRRKWQSDNWDHRQVYMRRYYEAHKEKIKTKSKLAYSKNKARAWNYTQKRRALEHQATANLECIRKFVESVRTKAFACCYWCGNKVSTKSIHFDHIIPLVKGGPHSVENICVACAPCNLSKHDKLIHRWNKHPQLFLSL